MISRQIRVLAGLFALIGGVVWLQFLIIPQAGSAGRLGSEVSGLRAKVERLRRDLRRLPEQEQKQKEMSSQYSAPAVSVPPEEQLPDLLEKIAQFARAAHVRVVTLRPKQDLAQMRPGPSGYLEIPLELTAVAGYHQVGRFLDRLEGSDSLVRLRELQIRPGKRMPDQEVKMLLLAFLTPAGSSQ